MNAFKPSTSIPSDSGQYSPESREWANCETKARYYRVKNPEGFEDLQGFFFTIKIYGGDAVIGALNRAGNP
jgi:hypothetical protein